MKNELNPPAIVQEEQSVVAIFDKAGLLMNGADKDEHSALDKFIEAGKLLNKTKQMPLEIGEWTRHLERIGVSRPRASESMRVAELPEKELAKFKTITDALSRIRSESERTGQPASVISEPNPHAADCRACRVGQPCAKHAPKSSANGQTEKDRLRALYGPGSTEPDEEEHLPPKNGELVGKKPRRERQPQKPRAELKDYVGNILPDSCRDAFADSTLAGMIEELEAVEEMLIADAWVKKAGKLTAHYPFLLLGKFDEHAFEALHRVQVALEALRAALPYALCPQCKGADTSGNGKCCKTCRGCGYLPQWKYEEVMA